jgi:hypothetical protein
VLKGIEPEVGKIRRFRMTIDAKNSAFFMKLVPEYIGRMGGIRTAVPVKRPANRLTTGCGYLPAAGQ